jgi:hypothetical protein
MKQIISEGQRATLERFRAECYLDKNVPLAIPTMPRPEIGESAHLYYERKHAIGPPGRFYPLHKTKNELWRSSRLKEGIDD